MVIILNVLNPLCRGAGVRMPLMLNGRYAHDRHRFGGQEGVRRGSGGGQQAHARCPLFANEHARARHGHMVSVKNWREN
eukprot:387090-Prorocentrum_minimum.AAC.2